MHFISFLTCGTIMLGTKKIGPKPNPRKSKILNINQTHGFTQPKSISDIDWLSFVVDFSRNQGNMASKHASDLKSLAGSREMKCAMSLVESFDHEAAVAHRHDRFITCFSWCSVQYRRGSGAWSLTDKTWGLSLLKNVLEMTSNGLPFPFSYQILIPEANYRTTHK